MKTKDGTLWSRADLEAYATLVVGVFVLLGQLWIFLGNLSVFLEYPDAVVSIWSLIFAIPILIIVWGAVQFRIMGGKLYRQFPMQHSDTSRLVLAVLRRLAIPCSLDGSKLRRFSLLQVKSTITVDRWNAKIEVCGSEKPNKVIGPLSTVYVGKVTKRNRDDVRRLLQEFDRACRPAMLSHEEDS